MNIQVEVEVDGGGGGGIREVSILAGIQLEAGTTISIARWHHAQNKQKRQFASPVDQSEGNTRQPLAVKSERLLFSLAHSEGKSVLSPPPKSETKSHSRLNPTAALSASSK